MSPDLNDAIDEAERKLDEGTRPRKHARLSMDEIMAEIDLVARDPGDRDRFKALKMLASTQTSAVMLDVPMTDDEFVTALYMCMLPAGEKLAFRAFKRAFPQAKTDLPPKLNLSDLPPAIREKAEKIITLKLLYREFPDIKRAGFPRGYPSKDNIVARKEWCQRTAASLFLEREQKDLDAKGPLAEPDA